MAILPPMTREEFKKKYGYEAVTASQPPVIPTKKPPTSLGQKVLNAGTAVSNFFGGKGVADTYGATIAKIGKTQQEKDFISQDQPSLKQTIGSGLQLGANFLPGAGIGVGIARKVGGWCSNWFGF